MIRKQEGRIGYVQFASFQSFNLFHAVFMRHGGASSPPWDSLNVGSTVGDDPDHVHENIRNIFSDFKRSPKSIHQVWQVHSASVAFANSPSIGETPQKADAIITSSPQVSLFMRFADCVPIMLYDPVQHAIGIGHAGWLGTVRNAGAALTRAMVEKFGSRPADLLAGLGPSIGPDHYTVGEEVVDQIMSAFKVGGEAHIKRIDGSYHLDLWTANRDLLEREGVSQIEVAEICTACHLEDWFSHRAESGRTGRFGAMIALGA
jgi:YfiH family protein